MARAVGQNKDMRGGMTGLIGERGRSTSPKGLAETTAVTSRRALSTDSDGSMKAGHHNSPSIRELPSKNNSVARSHSVPRRGRGGRTNFTITTIRFTRDYRADADAHAFAKAWRKRPCVSPRTKRTSPLAERNSPTERTSLLASSRSSTACEYSSAISLGPGAEVSTAASSLARLPIIKSEVFLDSRGQPFRWYNGTSLPSPIFLRSPLDDRASNHTLWSRYDVEAVVSENGNLEAQLPEKSEEQEGYEEITLGCCLGFGVGYVLLVVLALAFWYSLFVWVEWFRVEGRMVK